MFKINFYDSSFPFHNSIIIFLTFIFRKEFVDLYTDYILNKSVEKQYKAFHESFLKICGDSALCMFQAHELREVLIGNENYDWDVFESNAEYLHGYRSSHPTVSNIQC